MVVWDLLQLKRAATKKLDIAPHCGVISSTHLFYGYPEGLARYTLTGERAGRIALPTKVHVIAMSTPTIATTILEEGEQKNSPRQYLLAGCEDGSLYVIDVADFANEESATQNDTDHAARLTFKAHDAR